MDILLLIKVFIVALVGYFLGSVNTSIIISKFYGMDIRNHGSGNAGMTNTMRVLGKTAGVLVIVGDVLKGVLSCLLGLYLIGDINEVGMLGVIVGGTFSIIGHNWPIYFGFKGGKGILTSFTVILMMDYKIGLLLFGIFLVILAITKYVSLGSIVGSLLFPIMGEFFHKGIVFIIFASFVAILAVTRHNANIKRLINGTESKFGIKKSEEVLK